MNRGEEKLSKIADRGELEMMVGYAGNRSKGTFRLLNLRTNRFLFPEMSNSCVKCMGKR